jgi:hypothetical protein
MWGSSLYSTAYIEDPQEFSANVSGEMHQISFEFKVQINLDVQQEE